MKLDLDKQIDDLFDEEVAFLQALVRQKSTRGNEEAAQQLVHKAMDQDCQQVDILPVKIEDIETLPGFSPVTVDYSNMFNRIGHYGNKTGKGRSLILNGHIDVVPEGPLEGWMNEPYAGNVKGDKLFGRGSSDMKAGIVAKIFALKAIKSLGYQPDAPVYVQSVVEEECTGNGALACLAAGYVADAVLIGEPFNEVLVTEQVGVIWFQIRLSGVPVHAEQASKGVNAIEAMLPIIAAYRELEHKWNEEKCNYLGYANHEHPINLNVAEFHAGDWTSSVPAWAVLNLRIGIYPGDDILSRQKQIESTLATLIASNEMVKRAAPSLQYHGFLAEGYQLPPNTDAEKILAFAHKQVHTSELNKSVITATTDARFYGLYKGIPSLVYGPKGQGFHGFDEYVELESLRKTTKVYAHFISKWCGLTRVD